MTGTLRGRVALTAAALVAVAVLATTTVLSEGFATSERSDLDARLVARATEATALVERGHGHHAAGHPGGGVGRLARLVDGEPELLRILEDGVRIYEAGSEAGTTLPLPGAAGLADVEDADGGPWRTFVLRDTDRTVMVAAPLTLFEERLSALRRRTLIVGAFAVMLAAAAAWALSGIALTPLARLRDTAREVATTGDLTERVGTRGSDPAEVAAVAAAFDAMLTRLEGAQAATDAALQATDEALEAARRFAADAGHELRTPLTSLGTNLEVLARHPQLDVGARAAALAAADAEHHRLVALLDALQALARADATVTGSAEVDLADLADTAIADATRRTATAAFTLEGPERACVRGSADSLRIALDNLLGNAALHGGGRVVVRLIVDPAWVTLEVDDDGPGIAPEERGRVLARFTRGRHARGEGSGLGLAIVAAIGRAHGGTLTIEASPLGGARVRLRLPAAGSSAGPGGAVQPSPQG